MLKQALLKATGPLVRAEDLPSLGESPAAQNGAGALADLDVFVAERIAAGSHELYDEARQLLDRRVLAAVLRHTANNQSEAARILGITRVSLRAKLRELGMAVERVVRSDE